MTEADHLDARIHQAEGVLAALLDVSIDEAAVSLDLRAQFSGVSLAEAADQILDDHERARAGVEPPQLDARAIAILRQHLDQTADPLERPAS